MSDTGKEKDKEIQYGSTSSKPDMLQNSNGGKLDAVIRRVKKLFLQ